MKLVAAVIILLAGCGEKKSDSGGASGGKVASCHSEAVHSCREYRDGNLALGTENLEKLCTAIDKSAKFTTTACPTAKLIGTCKTNEHKDFFYEGYPVADKMEEYCKSSGGTFAK
jgi:hypothetical protein